MFALTSGHRYLYYSMPTDMRKGFDALSGIVKSGLRRDPTSGEVFIFINRRANSIKLLHWESGGMVLYYKRLERGTLEFPKHVPQDNSIEISWSELVLILEGISLKSVKKRLRYTKVV